MRPPRPLLDNGSGDHDACGVGFLADRRRRRTREWLDRGLEALVRMTHRGASGDQPGSADGAGVMTAIPWELLHTALPSTPSQRAAGWRSAREGIARHDRAVGMCFLPPDGSPTARDLIGRALAAYGWPHALWREVPIDHERLGTAERATCPAVFQVIVQALAGTRRSRRALDVSLYRARRAAEAALDAHGLTAATIVSLSRRTIVYKALVTPADLPRFYPDLSAPDYQTPFVLFHQRFSTNTFPAWSMAQPFRVLAHNGEINTILGNRLKARARQRDRSALPELAGEPDPAVALSGSDSRSLDAAFELLRQAGFSLAHACARLVPRAWEHDRRLAEDERAFERYQALVSDPWEGPAALAFADGSTVGMALDRNGFRPARIVTSRDGLVGAGSEAGIFDIPPSQIDRLTRLGPGEMLLVDLERGRLIENRAVRRAMARRRPYARYVAQAVHTVPSRRDSEHVPGPLLRRRQRIFGYTAEELELILRPMAAEGREPVGSMGDDTPLAVLSPRRRLLGDYFRQRFAQVTNPPIDPLRERLVMSLATTIGRRGRFLVEGAGDACIVSLRSPVLTCGEVELLAQSPDWRSATLSLVFDASLGPDGMIQTLDTLVASATAAVRGGAMLLVLSDRAADYSHAPVPALLAASAVHHALARHGLGMQAGIVVETGEARDSHQLATLLASGVGAVCPWLALETARDLASRAGDEPATVERRYVTALEQGLLKVFSKMGVCTAAGYTGSQLFEIVGLDPALVGAYFEGTPLVPGAVTLRTLADEACAWHAQAIAATGDLLVHPGFHGFRKDGDHHVFNPALVRALHRAAGSASGEAYRHFSTLVESRPATAVRDLLELGHRPAVPLDQVEPVDSICRRFFASAMSVGALAPEAHRVLAAAMNRLGGRSNSGEGGEEPDRRLRRPGCAWTNSTTKQVASARFGVTPGYLASAHEIQIKMAQGSKPGEGGQLPAEKVVAHIAALRHAQPHTPLISPPPHHDIYSIEDLAQLIHDLRAFQPRARINVKLVSTLGVGTIAAGVVKAGANAIQISGHAGGTGASPRGSIKHAGLPWEIGLLEAHRVLTARGTRSQVILQTDGGLATGRDIAMAAALGADEFGFGTAALVAMGCVMARQCHLNTCPVGIATQRPDLRARFAGTVDQVITYLRLVAGEVREILASLGLRSVSELVGRADLLQPRMGVSAGRLDVAHFLWRAESKPCHPASRNTRDDAPDPPSLNARLLSRAAPMLGRQPVHLRATVRNTDRAVGTALAGRLAARAGDEGTPHAPVTLDLTGHAGQSLGAFMLPGLLIHLTGAANDGVAKGMHGGRIVVVPPDLTGVIDPVLVGNAALYGATGGELFVAGRAGERFAVRNSGATAVVEGIGHHGCEYMTGGTVVVLGQVGANFAAGMTGGLAYVYDRLRRLGLTVSRDAASPALLASDEEEWLRGLLRRHVEYTGSPRAARILTRWRRAINLFRRVAPAEARESVTGVLEARPLVARKA